MGGEASRPGSTGLSHRERRILFAAVTEYIAHGGPVGSRTLSRRYGVDLSPATIRNVLADLEEAGFLCQPHTSAGRIPTERALRAFIDALTEVKEVPPSEQRAMRDRLGQIFSESSPGSDETLRRTGQYLSELSGAAAVIASSPADTRKLAQLRFIRTGPEQLLAVLVFADAAVENRYVQVDRAVTDEDLGNVHQLLADVVEGRTLAAVRDLFARRLQHEKSEVDELRRQAFALGHRAVSDLVRTGEDLVIEGSARLVELPEYADVERLKSLVRVLGERENLVELLDSTIRAGSVTVYIGSETGELSDAGLSLVVAPYGDDDKGGGTVGVLGPTRMDYARMMPLVETTAAAITAAIKRSK
jgi:heat-inducible transcriptional repressor